MSISCDDLYGRDVLTYRYGLNEQRVLVVVSDLEQMTREERTDALEKLAMYSPEGESVSDFLRGVLWARATY